ncbi:MAG: Rieske 2Fe-2S domain-containing protein [Chloroflexota bacterium]
MLTVEENELLTRVGPGTPMGELFRRFWLPALLPSELPAPDCDPIRFRILGEDLIAFRDSNGQVGFLAQNCPHRGASLFFGRNEECGLRCVYHGWKFDVTGACVDMPNEPAESNFKHKVQATAYPAAEFGGLVWIYMGPRAEQPALPRYQWCLQPDADNSRASKWLQDSNYTHGLEGNIDSSHVGFLHSTLGQDIFSRSGVRNVTPQQTVALDTDFGFVYGARRPTEDARFYWRITTYVFPVFTSIATRLRNGQGFFVLPRDDEHSWWFSVRPPSANADEGSQRPPGPMSEALKRELSDPTTGLIPGTFRHIRNKDNDYLIDREMQRTYNFSGMPAYNPVQDKAMTESMGALYDRRQEHLGTADSAIIHWRRLMLRAARQLELGGLPGILRDPDLFRAIPLEINSPEGDFARVWDEHHSAFLREVTEAAPQR